MYQRMSSAHPDCSKCWLRPQGYLQAPDCPPWGSLHPVHSPGAHATPRAIISCPSNGPAGPVSSSPWPCPAQPWGPTKQGSPVGSCPSLSLSPGRCPGLELPAPVWRWDGPLGCCQWTLGKNNESSHLRHVVLLCGLLLLLLLDEQLLLLAAPGCPELLKASLHLLQHLGGVTHHQLHTVLGCLQQLHCLLMVLSFHTLPEQIQQSKRGFQLHLCLFIWTAWQSFREFPHLTFFKGPLKRKRWDLCTAGHVLIFKPWFLC